MQLCFVLLHVLRQTEAMRVLCVWARASTSHTICQVDDICSSSLLCSFLRMHGCVRARGETRNIAFHDVEVHNLVGGIIFHVGMFPYRWRVHNIIGETSMVFFFKDPQPFSWTIFAPWHHIMLYLGKPGGGHRYFMLYSAYTSCAFRKHRSSWHSSPRVLKIAFSDGPHQQRRSKWLLVLDVEARHTMLRTVAWKRRFCKFCVSCTPKLKYDRFQCSVSNPCVGNTVLETARFHVICSGNGPFPTQRFQCSGWKHCVGNDGVQFCVLLLLQSSFKHDPKWLWITLVHTCLNKCQIVRLCRCNHFMTKLRCKTHTNMFFPPKRCLDRYIERDFKTEGTRQD